MRRIIVLLLILFIFSGANIYTGDKDNLENIIKEAILNANKSIIITNNILSSKSIVDNINKKSKNCDIKIILSKSFLLKSYSLHRELNNKDMDIFEYEGNIASFILIDNKQILTGDFSLSPMNYQKDKYIIQLKDKGLIDKFREYFNNLKNTSKSIDFSVIETNINDINSNTDKYYDKYLKFNCFINNIKKSRYSNTYILSIENSNIKIVIFPEIYEIMEINNINPYYFLNKSVYIEGVLIKHKKYGDEIILSDYKSISIKK